MRKIALIFPLLFLLCMLPAMASIDLVLPVNNHVSPDANVSFEYYPTLPGVAQCILQIGVATFPDATITNEAFNTFTVMSIAEGTHPWSITCNNATTSQSSVTRSLVVDTTPPSVEIATPANGSTTSENLLLFTPTDNLAENLSCSINLDGNYIATLDVNNNTQGSLSLDMADGQRQVMVTCLDEANNAGSESSTFTYDEPVDPLYLTIETNKQQYALGEQILLSIDTNDDANLSLEICPNQSGFVQCYTHLVNPIYPQTITLPYTNTSGDFLIEGVATLGNQTVINTTTYTVLDTMSVSISGDDNPEVNEEVVFTAKVNGAIGALSYLWTLSNGTTLTTPTIKRTYTAIGTFTEKLEVEDAAGNKRNASFTVNVDPYFTVTVKVIDAFTKEPIKEATVQEERDSKASEPYITSERGTTVLSLEADTYKLFVSASGYAFKLQDISVTEESTVTVELEPNDNEKPQVTLLSPEEGGEVSLPLEVHFKVEDATSSKCTLRYRKEDGDWVEHSGTREVAPGEEGNFTVTALEEKTYQYKVICEDVNTNLGESPERAVTIVQETRVEEPVHTGFGDDPLEIIDRAFGFYDAFTSEQKSVADLLGWEQNINLRKKELQRLARDYDGISFRRDLDEAGKNAERASLQKKIDEATALVPLDIQVIEKKKSVEYIKDDELLAFAPEIIAQKGYAMTPEQLVTFLKEVQQDFAKETTLMRAVLIYGDGAEKNVGIVSHTIKYQLEGGSAPVDSGSIVDSVGSLDGSYTLYEALPESIATSEKEIVTSEEHGMLHERPLRLEFPPLAHLTYYVEGDVTLAQLGEIKTILLKKPSAEDLQTTTGNAIFSSMAIDWKLSILLSLLLVIIILAVRHFDLIKHLRFLFYAESRKKPLHAIRTIVNDGLAHLEGGNLDQAVMRYKEAKLAYDHLSTYARNDVYENIINFKKMLDNHYFTMLADRIKNSIIEGHLEEAIDDFARLEGTFEQLSLEDQGELISLVTELGRRLGFDTTGGALA